MKKRLFLFISLALCLALSACDGKDSISGEVVEVTPTAIILEINEGKQVAVLLEENTYIFGMDDINGDDYKAAHTLAFRLAFTKRAEPVPLPRRMARR